MDSITAIFNIYLCDYGTVLVDKNKTLQLLATLCFRQNTCLTKLLIWRSQTWWIQGLSRTCGMKFKDFQAPVLFSSTFKAFNLGEKIQVLPRTFKDAWEPWLWNTSHIVVSNITMNHRFQLAKTDVRIGNWAAVQKNSRFKWLWTTLPICLLCCNASAFVFVQ